MLGIKYFVYILKTFLNLFLPSPAAVSCFAWASQLFFTLLLAYFKCFYVGFLFPCVSNLLCEYQVTITLDRSTFFLGCYVKVKVLQLEFLRI